MDSGETHEERNEAKPYDPHERPHLRVSNLQRKLCSAQVFAVRRQLTFLPRVTHAIKGRVIATAIPAQQRRRSKTFAAASFAPLATFCIEMKRPVSAVFLQQVVDVCRVLKKSQVVNA